VQVLLSLNYLLVNLDHCCQFCDRNVSAGHVRVWGLSQGEGTGVRGESKGAGGMNVDLQKAVPKLVGAGGASSRLQMLKTASKEPQVVQLNVQPCLQWSPTPVSLRAIPAASSQAHPENDKYLYDLRPTPGL
jgi:hypothetical protein